MYQKNQYWLDSENVTEENCNKIIKFGIDSGIKKGLTHRIEENDIRDSGVSWVSDDEAIRGLIWYYGNKINKDAKWKFDLEGVDDIQFTEYKEGQYYNWHIDSPGDIHRVYQRSILGVKQGNQKDLYNKDYAFESPPARIGMVRKLSIVIQLSDPSDYTGGEFEIAKLNTDAKTKELKIYSDEIKDFKQRGSVLAFPSSTYHRVNPVTSGIRYSLVSWIYGRPFK